MVPEEVSKAVERKKGGVPGEVATRERLNFNKK
jgi:hypothetical protein